MDNEQILLVIIGQKERDLALARILIRQQAEEIKRLQSSLQHFQGQAQDQDQAT